MVRIDAHQHFWNFDPARDAWITADMSRIRRDFLPPDLEPLLNQNSMSGCVAVQASQTDKETEFLLSLAERYPFVRGVVGWTDLQSKGLPIRLQNYQVHKKLKGFRHVLQAEARRDLMLQAGFKRGIQLLGEFGFTFDLLIRPDQLPYALQLVEAFPQTRFVLDHIGKPPIHSGLAGRWEPDIRALATMENVWCKVSGMITEADWQHWKPGALRPYLDVVTEAFGMDRLMFGSDWPVCLVAGAYEAVVDLADKYFAQFSATDQEKFWSRNATNFYKL